MSNNTEETLPTPHSTSQFVSRLTRITVCFATMLSLISMNLLEADDELLFFKQRIEPVLKKNRYGCHSAAPISIKCGLRLDTRSMVLRRGESGPVVVPGNLGGRLLQIHLKVTDRNRGVIIIVSQVIDGRWRGQTCSGCRTDDIGWAPVEDGVHINDFHATLLHLFGLDHLKLSKRFGGFDIRLTNVGGNVVEKLLQG
jgi:hypothetical protein